MAHLIPASTLLYCGSDLRLLLLLSLQFEEKLLEVVQSAENFISDLYRAGVSTIDFPNPTDSRFYHQLAELAGSTIGQVDKPFESGLQLTGYMRRLLAKLSHKDW